MHSTNPTEEPVHYRVDYLSPSRPSHPNQYSISLSPSVIPSVGPFISSVISSGVARYGSYKLLGPVAIYRNGKFQSVPQNKESIFQDRSIPLVEKRRLMRFLVFASGEFETSPELQGKEDTSFDYFLHESFGLTEDISRLVMFSLAGCNFSGGKTTIYFVRRHSRKLFRISVDCIAPRAQLYEVSWAVWLIAIPCWLLRGIGRDNPGILSCHSCKWRGLHPRSEDFEPCCERGAGT